MRSVRFIAISPPYNVGEIAGFSEERAQALVDAKAAVFNDAPESEETPEVDAKAAVFNDAPESEETPEATPRELRAAELQAMPAADIKALAEDLEIEHQNKATSIEAILDAEFPAPA